MSVENGDRVPEWDGPVTEADLRIVSMAAHLLTLVTGNNDTISAAVYRLADAFINARANGVTSVTIDLDDNGEKSIGDTLKEMGLMPIGVDDFRSMR